MKRILCAVLLCAPFAALAGVDEDVRALQNEWAQIKYARPAGEQEKALASLTKSADAVRDKYAGRAEPQIWYGIIAGSYAGARGGLGALGLAKDAKKAFEQALEIDPKALDGSAYTSLGSLYYQVPGWPITNRASFSFGNPSCFVSFVTDPSSVIIVISSMRSGGCMHHHRLAPPSWTARPL